MKVAAPPLEPDEFFKLTRKQDDKLELSDEEQIRLKKGRLEWFYNQPVTRDLILMDEEGKLRKQISHMDYLLLDKREKGKQLREALRKGQEKNPDNEPHVIGMLLEKAGIYNVKQREFFDRSVITEQSLSEFVKTCRKRQTKALVERVLDIEMRRDVVRDPVSQLKAILKLIGLTTGRVDTVRGSGSPVYQYRLDADAYQRMVALVDTHRRRGKNPKKV